MNFLFDQNKPSELILEWRDKIIEKVDQLQASGINLADAKEKLRTYLQRLTQEREKYVREGKKQIKTLPEKMKQEHPEGGLNVKEYGTGNFFITVPLSSPQTCDICFGYLIVK